MNFLPEFNHFPSLSKMSDHPSPIPILLRKEIEIRFKDRLPDNFQKETSIFRKKLAKSLLWEELQVLNRLCYKNKNQHKSSDYYRKLQHVYTYYHILNSSIWDLRELISVIILGTKTF
jgi:hypothetical protein